MNDIASAYKEALVERVRSPFFSSLVIFGLAFNWKAPLLLLFGDGNIESRIQLVELSTSLVIGGVVPISCAIFYWVIYPTLVHRVFVFTHRYKFEQLKVSSEFTRQELKSKLNNIDIEMELAERIARSDLRGEDRKQDMAYRIESQKNEFELEKLKLQTELERSKREDEVKKHKQA
jgi:hypothetical protein